MKSWTRLVLHHVDRVLWAFNRWLGPFVLLLVGTLLWSPGICLLDTAICAAIILRKQNTVDWMGD